MSSSATTTHNTGDGAGGIITAGSVAIGPGGVVSIPCCLCGTMIFPNAANQCSICLAQQYNLKELLLHKHAGKHQSQMTTTEQEYVPIYQCRQCRTFARTPNCFEAMELESPQLLSLCLKQIPALSGSGGSGALKFHIVDALWVWTEPHSMRLKIRVTVRTEIHQVPLQQRILIDYKIHWKNCPHCEKEFTSRTWTAIVQLRQKRTFSNNNTNNSNNDSLSNTRKGLATLEMALRRNKEIRKDVLKMDACRQGLDFYFGTLTQAQKFSHYISKLAPMKIKQSQKLVSTDSKNNTAHIKHTITADMVPLCKDDLILVTKESKGSNLAGRLGLVVKVSNHYIHIVDACPKRPATNTKQNNKNNNNNGSTNASSSTMTMLDRMELSADAYYKKNGGEKSFPIVQTSERMIRFVVLDVELYNQDYKNNTNNNNEPILYQGPVLTRGMEKYALAEALVARESDMGSNDCTFSCVTHLGHLIQPGDIVWGYDMASTSMLISTNSPTLGVVDDLESLLNSNTVLPDVILVKKVSSSSSSGNDNNYITKESENDNVGGGVKGNNDNDEGNDDDDDEARMEGTKRISKRKLRRRKHKDKKQRDLEETAIRMGFLEDENDNENYNDDNPPLDPEMAADLEEMERELANYQQEQKEEQEQEQLEQEHEQHEQEEDGHEQNSAVEEEALAEEESH